MSEDESFGQRLKRLRTAAGLTQLDLAGGDLGQSHISLLESGRRMPTRRIAETLAKRLGCTTDELLTGNDDPHELVLIARAELGIGHPEEARRLLSPLAAALEQQSITRPFDFNVIEIYATALERLGDIEGAATWLERLRQAALRDPRNLPLLSIGVALVRCYRDLGEFTSAIEAGEQTLTAYRDLGLIDSSEYFALSSTVAGVYAEAGDLVHASVLLDGLAIEAEQAGDVKSQAYAYWNGAIVAAERGRIADGQRLIERASSLLDATDDYRSRSRIQNSRAWMLLQQTPPDADGARAILRKELPGLRQHAGAIEVALVEANLARAELLLGRPQVAKRLAATSLKRMPVDAHSDRAWAIAAHGSALVACGEMAAGVQELEDAVDLMATAGASRQAATLLNELAAVYASLGDSERAFEASRRALTLVGIRPAPVPPQTPAAQKSSKRRSKAGALS